MTDEKDREPTTLDDHLDELVQSHPKPVYTDQLHKVLSAFKAHFESKPEPAVVPE